MSIIEDGLANVNALTNQINSLKKQSESQTANPTANSQDALLELEKNFNEMLNSLMGDSKSEAEEKKSQDPLSSLIAPATSQAALLASPEKNAPKDQPNL